MRFSEIIHNPSPVEEAIKEHIAQGVPFSECMFRPGSRAFTEFYTRVREMRESLDLDWQDQELLDTDIGECIVVEGERVPLDVPIAEEVDLDEAMDTFIVKYKSRAGKEGQIKIKARDKKEAQARARHQIKNLANINSVKQEVELDEAEYQGRKVKLNSPKRGGSKKYYVYVKNPKTGKVKKVSWGDTTGLSTKAKNRGAVRSFVARHKCKQKNDKTKAGYWACRTPRYKALGVKGGQWW
jgi:hypothetical protein